MQAFYFHVVYLKCTQKHYNRLFESAVRLKHFDVLYFPNYLLYGFIYVHKLNIAWCQKVKENFYIKRVTKTFFVTMTSNIARKEHTKNHKEKYKRV